MKKYQYLEKCGLILTPRGTLISDRRSAANEMNRLRYEIKKMSKDLERLTDEVKCLLKK